MKNQKDIKIVKLKKLSAGYALFNNTGYRMTGYYYFHSKDDALIWAKNWLSSYTSMTFKIIYEGPNNA